MQKHLVEDQESWTLFLERQGLDANRRQLKHKHHHHHHKQKMEDIEFAEEQEYFEKQEEEASKAARKRAKHKKKQDKRIEELYSNPGILKHTTHGMMIDAGSSGSRLHIFEWEPRKLSRPEDIAQAVSGKKISFPGTDSR